MGTTTTCPGEEGVMPRRPVPVTETKAEKFERLANLRTNLILDGLRKLGSLSNRNHYAYSEDEVNRIFDTIEEAVSDAKSRFLGRMRGEFSLRRGLSSGNQFQKDAGAHAALTSRHT